MAAINETVYQTSEEGHVMSEKVSSLATNIYKEFEQMIKKYDEDVVKELMPLTVGLLESLDQALSDKQESEVELELLRDDNEQLLTQYEREKQLRKVAEQRYLEMEDDIDGEKKKAQEKIENMESVIRMLELKGKNSSDHVSRMEEKEAELKKEYTKLHERYTELFRTHMDYMERTKILMGTDRMEVANSPRTKGGFQLPNLRPVSMALGQTFNQVRSGSTPPSLNSFDDLMSPRSVADSNVSLKSELGDLDSPAVAKASGDKKGVTKTCDKEQVTDSIDVRESATATKKNDKSDDTAQTDTSKTDSKSLDTESTQTNSSDEKVKNSSGDVTGESDRTSQVKDEKTDSGSDRVEKSSQDSNQSDQLVIKSDLSPHSSDRSELKVESESTVIQKQTDKSVSDEKVTSTPENKESRKRYDSRISIEDDAEFEEDKIMGLDHTLAQIVATTPELTELEESIASVKSVRNIGPRNNDSIFDELNVQDADVIGDVDFGADITDSENEDENEQRSTVSDNFFGMGKELENLILENTELLETKNALNIVKDDLIAKVDELSGEMELLKEEISSLQTVKKKLNSRIEELETELKNTKEELEKKNNAAKEGEEEDDVPMAQRKRFTRVEMARVLMERNQYKERLMELQEAVRWTEMIRASREHPEVASPQKQKKGSIWNFFSNLVAPAPPPPPPSKQTMQRPGGSKTQII